MSGTDVTGTGVDDHPQPDVRRPNEIRALSALMFADLRAFPRSIRDMHLGIAERAFRGVGPAARPVQVIHDALSRRAYGAIGGGAALVGRAVDRTMEQRGIGEKLLLSATRPGSAVISATKGLIRVQLGDPGSDRH